MQAVNEKGKIYIFLQLLAEVLFVLSSRFFFPAKKKVPGPPVRENQLGTPNSSLVQAMCVCGQSSRRLNVSFKISGLVAFSCLRVVIYPLGMRKKKERERDPARQRTGSSKRGIYLLQPKWKDNSPGRQRKKAKSFKVVVFVTISWEDR